MLSTRGQNTIWYHCKGHLERDLELLQKGINGGISGIMAHYSMRNLDKDISATHFPVHILFAFPYLPLKMYIHEINHKFLYFSIVVFHNTSFYNGTYHFMLNFFFYACYYQHRIRFIMERTSFNPLFPVPCTRNDILKIK